MNHPPPKIGLVESVSRKAYWIGICALIAAMIVTWFFLGIYQVPPLEDRGDGFVQDPIVEFFSYNLLGVVVINLFLQFFLANLLFWLGAWVRLLYLRHRTTN